MGDYKKQHYVQQSYLRRFSVNGTQVCVFDKVLNRSFTNGIRDVAQESHFYRLPDGLLDENGAPTGLDPMLIEKWFHSVEGDFNQDIQELVEIPEGGTLTVETSESLARSMVIQYLRTRAFRNIIIDSAEQLAGKLSEELIKANFGEENLKYAPKVTYSEQAAGLMQIQRILDDERVYELTDILKGHVWSVLINETAHPFYTSDSPVVLYNHLKRPGFRPGLGLGSVGIEIAFPLSSTRLLSMAERTPLDASAIENDGVAKKLAVENVEFYNSLQVLESERQLYCEKPDWELVEDMIKENPKLTEKGSRVSVD